MLELLCRDCVTSALSFIVFYPCLPVTVDSVRWLLESQAAAGEFIVEFTDVNFSPSNVWIR